MYGVFRENVPESRGAINSESYADKRGFLLLNSALLEAFFLLPPNEEHCGRKSTIPTIYFISPISLDARRIIAVISCTSFLRNHGLSRTDMLKAIRRRGS